jgi:hypothetical protein
MVLCHNCMMRTPRLHTATCVHSTSLWVAHLVVRHPQQWPCLHSSPSPDDPLSAVDPKLAASIFQRALVEFLAQKTRVLATHSPHFAAQADLCLILEGKVVAHQVQSTSALSRGRACHVPCTSPVLLDLLDVVPSVPPCFSCNYQGTFAEVHAQVAVSPLASLGSCNDSSPQATCAPLTEVGSAAGAPSSCFPEAAVTASVTAPGEAAQAARGNGSGHSLPVTMSTSISAQLLLTIWSATGARVSGWGAAGTGFRGSSCCGLVSRGRIHKGGGGGEGKGEGKGRGRGWREGPGWMGERRPSRGSASPLSFTVQAIFCCWYHVLPTVASSIEPVCVIPS